MSKTTVKYIALGTIAVFILVDIMMLALGVRVYVGSSHVAHAQNQAAAVANAVDNLADAAANREGGRQHLVCRYFTGAGFTLKAFPYSPDGSDGYSECPVFTDDSET